MRFDIEHRFTGSVIFEAEIECAADASYSVKLGLAVRVAVKARADLAGANLARANLARADLTGAYLTRADLTGANLMGAYLAHADLTRADLTHANLAGANLTGAYLTGAYLARADLTRADLTGANLTGANLTGAYLTGAYLAHTYLARADLAGAYLAHADLTRADLAGAYLAHAKNLNLDSIADPASVPVIPNIDATILAAVEKAQAAGKAGLDMAIWHTCATTHCRAGWAITLAGKEGIALEEKHGPFLAGCLIYSASRPGKAPPHFFASTEDAMADLRQCASQSPSQATGGGTIEP